MRVPIPLLLKEGWPRLRGRGGFPIHSHVLTAGATFCRASGATIWRVSPFQSLAVQLHIRFIGWRCMMICPGCGTENEMAYSVLSGGLICLEPACGFEME